MKTPDQFLRIAKVVGAHGLNGRLKLAVITDLIERFTPGSIVYLKIDSKYTPFQSIEFIETGRYSIIKLEDINDRDAAASLKGTEVYIAKNEAEKTRDHLEGDAFYYYDLIGCKAYCNGRIFGNVVDIMEIGENNILVLKNDKGKEFLIPFIHSMVDTFHIFDGRIDINPVEGLFDLSE